MDWLSGDLLFCGYICLHMVSSYYLAPVDLIAVLYLGRLAFFRGTSSVAVKIMHFRLVCFVLCQDVSLSAFRMYERKNVIHAKSEMAKVIKRAISKRSGRM